MSPYPSRSLVEVFTEDSPSSSVGASGAPGAAPLQVMPRPPSTYTASAPPYQISPNGYDESAGSAAAPARPAPAAARDDSDSVPGYPTQSLTDLFSR